MRRSERGDHNTQTRDCADGLEWMVDGVPVIDGDEILADHAFDPRTRRTALGILGCAAVVVLSVIAVRMAPGGRSASGVGYVVPARQLDRFPCVPVIPEHQAYTSMLVIDTGASSSPRACIVVLNGDQLPATATSASK